MTDGLFLTLLSTRSSQIRPQVPTILLILLPVPANTLEYPWLPGGTSGETPFLEPNSLRDNEDMVVYFPRRGYSDGRIEARMKGHEIEIVANHSGHCLYSFRPDGQILSSSRLYQRYRIGRLPIGNYRIRLYSQDLSESSRSRSLSISESFSIMPAR